MIGVGIAGARVEQDVQTVTVEHQPRQERRQQHGRESDLIHRLRVRPDRRVVPASKDRWLVDAIKGGKKLDDFLINKSGRKGRKKRRSKR